MSQFVNSNLGQSLETLLVQARTQIVKYLPRHLDADKMIYVALETVRADSFLRQCEPLSIVQAVLEASQLGLMLGNKLGHARLLGPSARQEGQQHPEVPTPHRLPRLHCFGPPHREGVEHLCSHRPPR